MVVTILAVQKAGGAYVPLDPTFPIRRLAFIIQDSDVSVVVTQSHLRSILPSRHITIVDLDRDKQTLATLPDRNLASDVTSGNLAYVIYTSGSTGVPKGVMVEHRNVVNFFTGMDQRIPLERHDENVFLAVTSLSFDISVLELLWTLTRGLKVVIYADRYRPHNSAAHVRDDQPMQFGLFFFSSDQKDQSRDRYRLLMESARFADRNGFVSLSTPERHFHAFGGLYPNPAVTGAALAAITDRIQIRAGSVVLPLHHPIRIAEEWSVVDNLSHGRVGISFASGWQPVDFVIRPDSYHERHRLFYEGIETVRKLWRGESVEFPDPDGKRQLISTLPRPIQQELPVWVTTAGSSETWIRAAEIGANVLTHLLGQTIDEVAAKIVNYRQAYENAGHAGTGLVVLMMHTFVGDDMDQVRTTVHGPMIDYLGSSLSLVQNVADAWTAFKRRADGTAPRFTSNLSDLTPQEMRELLEFSFERYISTSSLFGTPEYCASMVRRLKGIGVDEIACLIDFGIEAETVLNHLPMLNQVRILSEQQCQPSAPATIPPNDHETIASLINRHRVTHLQCTPSMASMIVADQQTRDSLKHIKAMMIGGEAFPSGLARELSAATEAVILNMYGPTETTIWSSTYRVKEDERSIPIGHPIANTRFYILDDAMRPVPIGTVGELYIGGESVARGYLNQPKLTSERFIRHRLVGTSQLGNERPGERIYRTGDLARFRDDGTVEFIGRTDHQVKLLGYRIELGEIEAVMMDHPQIREAVVVARALTDDDDVRLVAFYVGNPHQPLNDTELRAHIAERLPAYMVPSQFVALASFPQTPNRKIDRNALPSLAKPMATHETAVAATTAENDVEAKITQIWQDVLDLATIDRNDNFFDLGGHSLLALKAHRQLCDTFDKEISITDLFRFPTVSALAAYLSDNVANTSVSASQQRGAMRRDILSRRRPPPPVNLRSTTSLQHCTYAMPMLM